MPSVGMASATAASAMYRSVFMAVTSLRRRRIDDGRDPHDLVRGEATQLRVASHQRLLARVIDAIQLVGRDIALNPLHARSEAGQHAAGLLRNGLQLRG